MKKFLVLILAFTLLLAGCGAGGETEDQIAFLSEQLKLLEDRVDALETENALLRLQLEQLSTPQAPEQPQVQDDPTAELYFADWSAEDGTLTILDLFARVMKLGSTQVSACSLTLYLNGTPLETTLLTLLPGEATDSLELELGFVSFPLPTLESGDVLELVLEAALPDGRLLTAPAGSWDCVDGELIMVAG